MKHLFFLFILIFLYENLGALNINFLPDWKKEGRLSYSSENGNNDEDNFAARLKLDKPKGKNRYYFDLQYYLERDDDHETENELILNARSEHSISKNILFFNGYYNRDKFSGIQTRILCRSWFRLYIS